MHVVHLPMVFELSSHKSPAIVCAPLSKFQQALKYLKSRTPSPTFGGVSLCCFFLGDSASSIICQSGCNSKNPVPTHTN